MQIVPELKRNFYQRKNAVRGEGGASARNGEVLRKLAHLNNFDQGFLQHSPTLRCQHLVYFMFKRRESFPGFEALAAAVDIDKVNGFLKDRELWKTRLSQHAREFQWLVNAVERSRFQSKALMRGAEKGAEKNEKRKRQFDFLQELLVKKEFIIDLEKTYQKTIAKFENFLLKYLKRVFFGSSVSEDFSNLFDKFNEKLSQAKDYLQMFNSHVKEKIVEYKKKPL